MQENHFEGYQKSMDELKAQPEILQFQKMCYELFEALELGRKFMEYIDENVLLKPSADIGDAHYQNKVTWGEGYKAAFQTIRSLINSHKQVIKAGAEDARRNEAQS